MVFCCSCCSSCSSFSSLACLFSFGPFSAFSSRYYRSPVRVGRVRATLRHSRADPPSRRAGGPRQREADFRVLASRLRPKDDACEGAVLSNIPSTERHGPPAGRPAAEDALSSASSRKLPCTEYSFGLLFSK